MTILNQMLNNYNVNTIEEKKNAIKEILQEVILAALSKTNFFNHAAFYGGTALRIFYNMDRFSEDLDFTLLSKDESFNIEKYIPTINDTINSFGLNFKMEVKHKTKDSNINSAFIKGNTKETFMVIYSNSDEHSQIIHNEKITIKFEVDVNPPKFANTELKYRLLPFPYQIRIYDESSLFAKKVHAILARTWKRRIKGRDLYDFIFYLSRNAKVNLKHLEARLKQTKTIGEDIILTKEILIDILNERFDQIDYELAKEDVYPFIKDVDSLNIWSREFFKSITSNIKVI